MRDYTIGMNGVSWLVADAPTECLHVVLAQQPNHVHDDSDGYTLEQVLERVRVELVARGIEGRL